MKDHPASWQSSSINSSNHCYTKVQSVLITAAVLIAGVYGVLPLLVSIATIYDYIDTDVSSDEAMVNNVKLYTNHDLL